MKTINHIAGKLSLILMFMALVFTGCEKTFDEPPYPQDPDITPTHTIKQLQQMYTNAPVTINEDVILSGIVVGSDSTGNLFKKIVVQDETAGIDIEIDQSNLFNTYPVGKRVFIYAKGLTLATYGGMLELGLGVNDQNQPVRIPGSVISQYIATGTSRNVVMPIEVTIDQLNENYQNMLVKVLGVEFSNLNDTYADAVNKLTTNRTIKDCKGNTLSVRTSGYASFAGEKVAQGNGSITGIYTFFNNEKQFIVRSLKDVSEMTGQLCGGGSGNPGGGELTLQEGTPVSEDFEAGTKSGYDAGLSTGLTTGVWGFTDGFIGTDANDLKEGTKSVRLRGNATTEASLYTNFDIVNLKTLTFKFGGTNFSEPDVTKEISVEVYVSKDGGATWTKTGDKVTGARGTFTTATYAINAASGEKTRVKIVNTSAVNTTSNTNRVRINIDDITLSATQTSGGGNTGGGTALSEDFAALTDGGNIASSGTGAPSGTPWTGNDNFTVVDKAYAAGGMVKLGTSSVAGYITSKPLNLSANGGSFTVSFDVKGWTAAGTIIVSANGTDQTVNYTAVMSGTPETKTVTFTGGTASTTVKIATGAPARAFLDNIVIKTN